MIIGVLAGVDNFRAGLGLGALSIDPLRRKQMMLYFLMFESMMPTLGLLAGNYIGESTTADHLANFIGCAILGSLGIYVILNSTLKRKEEKKEKEKKVLRSYWIIIGLPLSLRFDNLVAGTGLGVLGFPILLSAIIIGGVSGLVSITGLRIGAAVRKKLDSEKTDFVSGVFLLAIALFSLVISNQ